MAVCKDPELPPSQGYEKYTATYGIIPSEKYQNTEWTERPQKRQKVGEAGILSCQKKIFLNPPQAQQSTIRRDLKNIEQI